MMIFTINGLIIAFKRWDSFLFFKKKQFFRSMTGPGEIPLKLFG